MKRTSGVDFGRVLVELLTSKKVGLAMVAEMFECGMVTEDVIAKFV